MKQLRIERNEEFYKLRQRLKKALIINDFEIFNNGSRSFKHSEITEDLLRKDFYTLEEIESKLQENGLKLSQFYRDKAYTTLGITVAVFKLPFRTIYWYKKDVDKFIDNLKDIIDNYISYSDIKFCDIEGLENANKQTVLKALNNADIDSVKNPPLMKAGKYFRKKDVDKFMDNFKYIKDNYIRYQDIKGVTKYYNTSERLKKRYNIDSIKNPPLMEQGLYIKKDDAEKIKEEEIKKAIKYKEREDKERLIIEKNKEYYKLREKLKKAFIIQDYINDAKFSQAVLKRIKDNNLKYEYIKKEVAKYILIDEELAEKIFNIMTSDVFQIHNNGSRSFEPSEITEELIREKFYTYKEIESKLQEEDVSFQLPKWAYRYEHLKITIISFRIPFRGIYYYKKDMDTIIENIRDINHNYVKFHDIEGLENFLQNNVETSLKKTYGIDSVRNPPFLKQGVYIKKDDVEKIKIIKTIQSKLSEVNTPYEHLMVLVEGNRLKIKKPKTEKMFLSFCLNRSNTVKQNYANLHFEIYKQLCNETLLKKELEDMSEEEQANFGKKLLNLVEELEVKKVQAETIYFLRYLQEEYNFSSIITYGIKKENAKKKVKSIQELPYEIEDFIELYTKIVRILYLDEKIDKLIENYSLSASLLYIYLHYCVIWRRMDLVKCLPTPNMRLIEKYLNGKDFITWLREGNKFTEEMGRIICQDIEEQVIRLEKRAQKTNALLECYIPEHTYQSLGLLFCICEMNRIKERKKTLISRYSTTEECMSSNLSKKLNIDEKSILKDTFTNRRANKTYASIIEQTAEAFGWFGYELVRRLRSHKCSDAELAEVTKVYLNKDVTEASKEAFENGTMGSIKYQLLSLVDDKFKHNNRQEKIQKASDLKLTPLQIETALKILQKNSVDIEEYLTSNIKNEEEAKKLLKEIIYGKNYCKHIHTKCLIKSMDSSKGTINTEGVTVSHDCKLNSLSGIGCPFLISKHYFLYEFKDKFDMLLDSIENSKSDIDKALHVNRLIQLYVPFIFELQNEFGKDIVTKTLDVERYNKISNQINGIRGVK